MLILDDNTSTPNLGLHSFNNGVTNTKQCTTRNGVTSCKEKENKVKSSCQGFSIGGNCNGQNDAIDQNTESSPTFGDNTFQMGHFSNPNQRFGLNRVPSPKLKDMVKNKINVRTTTSSTTSMATSTTTTRREGPEVATMSPELQEMRDHIMEMNAHDLRDAIMDPMMLGNWKYYYFILTFNIIFGILKL